MHLRSLSGSLVTCACLFACGSSNSVAPLQDHSMTPPASASDAGMQADAGGGAPSATDGGATGGAGGTAPPGSDAGTPADAGTTTSLAPCKDGAPYCAVDLTPAGAGRALRVDDDGNVLFFRNAGRNVAYALYDPRTGTSTPLVSLPWTYTAVASGQSTLLYGDPNLGNPGCWVHVYSRDKGDQDLGPPPICAALMPIAIEGRYALVEAIGGGSPATDRPPRGFLHVSGAGWIDLGTLGGDSTAPSGVNAAGMVVGASTDASGAWHAFLWQNGVMTDMHRDWGSGAIAISPDGSSVLVGPQTAPDGSLHDFGCRAGTLRDLGLHPEFDSLHGVAISATGDSAIGAMGATCDEWTPMRAFIHEGGVLYDLNSLVASHLLHLEEAVSIGPGGTMAAIGLAPDGTQHAAVLLRQHAPADGGGSHELPASQIFATGQRAAALALDDTRAYWIDQTGSTLGASTFEVRSMLKSGGPVQVVSSGSGVSADLAVSATHVYLTALQCVGACATARWNLLRFSKEGGAIETLGGGEGQIALDEVNAYVSSPQDGSEAVLAYPFAGGPPVVLAHHHWTNEPGIQVDADHLYFDTSDQSIGSMPKAGGAVSTLASTSGDMFFFNGRMKVQ